MSCMTAVHGKGNHVQFMRFVLLAVIDEANTRLPFFCHSKYNSTIIRRGFCEIQNNQGVSKGYQPQPLTLADNTYLDLN